MPRPKWKSQSCGTCQRRKVKCDKKRPVCDRCRKASRDCEGPYRNGNVVFLPAISRQKSNSTPSGETYIDIHVLYGLLNRISANTGMISPSSASHYQLQLLSSFLLDYLPKDPTWNTSEQQTSFSWFEDLPYLVGRGLLLDISLAALSLAFLGRKHHDETLTYWSRQYYRLAVRRIQMFAEHTEAARTDDVIGASMILAVYELYNCSQGETHAWILHAQAACQLLEERGPYATINERLLCRVRTIGFYDASGRRKSSFLARPEWRLAAPKKELYDQLLNVMLPLPSIQELCDQIKASLQSPELESLKQQFLRQFSTIETELWEWYLDTLSRQTKRPFVTRPAAPGELSLIDDKPDLKEIFPDIIEFSSRYMSQLLLLPWMGFLVLYSEASTVMQLLDIKLERTFIQLPEATRSEPNRWFHRECELLNFHPGHAVQNELRSLHEIESVAEFFAVRLCQVMALCDKYSYGSAMRQPVMPPLWTAQQFFESRSHGRLLWCQTVLQRFQSKGVGYGRELATLSYQGYMDIGRRLCQEAAGGYQICSSK